MNKSLRYKEYDLTPLKLIRTYKAVCPFKCNLGLSETVDPTIRINLHPECDRRIRIIQRIWRNKVKVSKLRKITRILLKKLDKINYSDFIILIYKFL